MAFNEWRWWKKYRPRLEVVACMDLRIGFVNDSYQLELPISIEYRNRNNRYKARINRGHIVALVYHRGKGWEGKPYRLYSNIRGEYDLQPSEIKQETFLYKCEAISAKPLIGDTVTCKLHGSDRGWMWSPYVGLHGKLKREGRNKFKVNVIWELENDTN